MQVPSFVLAYTTPPPQRAAKTGDASSTAMVSADVSTDHRRTDSSSDALRHMFCDAGHVNAMNRQDDAGYVVQ